MWERVGILKPYYETDLFKIDSIEQMRDDAVEFIRECCAETVPLVLTSGGKDSIVITHLMKLSGISFKLQSTLTGIDPPQLIRFIRKHYPECSFVRPHQSFWHLITTHNPPAGTGRGIKWCCTKIKENPSKKTPIKTRLLGIRAEESPARAKYGCTNYFQKTGETHHYPIFGWKRRHVWKFIKNYNLPYPKLYDQGFERLGCVVCPNHHGRHEPYRKRWPNHFKCFERYVKVWWEKRQRQGKEMWHNSPEDFLIDWYAGRFYYYIPNSKNESKQLKLFLK